MDSTTLECPQCGATMTVHPKESEAVCEYCGHRAILKREKTEEEKAQHMREMSYAREAGRQQALEEAEGHRQKRKAKAVFIAVAVIVIAACIGFFATEYSKPEINPFDYAKVVFSGTDGEGKASIKATSGNGDVDVSSISFEVSPSDGLTEGDFVTVTASSANGKYRLASSSQKYEVQGLQLYLTDLKSLGNKQLKTISSKNKELQKANLDAAYSDVETSAITPVELCLLTNGSTNSKLYVISKTTCKKGSQSKTHFLVSEMDDAVAGDGSISFGYSCYKGNLSGAVSENGGGFIFSYASVDGAVADIKSSDATLTYSERALR